MKERIIVTFFVFVTCGLVTYYLYNSSLMRSAIQALLGGSLYFGLDYLGGFKRG